MRRGASGRRTLRIVWEFRVKPDRIRAFEKDYGGNGAWARLFRRGKGYRETLLLRDREVPGRYLTIDVWDDLGSYRAFSAAHAEAYGKIDRRCEGLTDEERCLGFFETP